MGEKGGYLHNIQNAFRMQVTQGSFYITMTIPNGGPSSWKPYILMEFVSFSNFLMSSERNSGINLLLEIMGSKAAKCSETSEGHRQLLLPCRRAELVTPITSSPHFLGRPTMGSKATKCSGIPDVLRHLLVHCGGVELITLVTSSPHFLGRPTPREDMIRNSAIRLRREKRRCKTKIPSKRTYSSSPSYSPLTHNSCGSRYTNKERIYNLKREEMGD
jgi:hypothetical protein